MTRPEDRTDAAIVHRYDHALSLDRITAACAGCEGYWPCDLAGHTGFYGYNALHDEDIWRCADDCSHSSHSATPGADA